MTYEDDAVAPYVAEIDSDEMAAEPAAEDAAAPAAEAAMEQ